MNESRQWEQAIDQPGSAGPGTVRRGFIFAAIIVVMAIAVAALGDIALTPYPQFTTFHAGFVFLVDAITAFLLFGLFVYRRFAFLLILASAFLFNALTMLPFLLTFPGALQADGPVIGGQQSAIWLWHFWHTLFPAMVAVALLTGTKTVTSERLLGSIVVAVGAVSLLVALGAAAVTVFHDQLPVLIESDARVPFKPNFYWAGGIAGVATTVALVLAVRAARRRSILHLWLSVALLALLADVSASLGGFPRYSLGWYMGRGDAMVAAGALLLALLTDINRLYRLLVEAMRGLSESNTRLGALVKEKDVLLAQLRQSQEQIRHMAFHDAVTDLPNRRLFMESLVHTLAQSDRHGHSTALLFLDLDRFKAVNDTLGHDVGDALLREVAARLKRCVRAGDVLARLGGDEFVVVLPEIAMLRDAVAVAEKALKLVAEPMRIMNHEVHVTFSIGIAICTPQRCIGVDEFLKEADAAMYVAKGAGGNRYRLSVAEDDLAPGAKRTQVPDDAGAAVERRSV